MGSTINAATYKKANSKVKTEEGLYLVDRITPEVPAESVSEWSLDAAPHSKVMELPGLFLIEAQAPLVQPAR